MVGLKRDVSLIFFYRNDKILVQDRRNLRKLGELWGFFGGKIEDGETPEEGLVREVKEELSYDLKQFVFIRQSVHYASDLTVTVNAFAAPCPDFSQFKQLEGDGMRLVTHVEAQQMKFNPWDYEIMEYVFAFIRSQN